MKKLLFILVLSLFLGNSNINKTKPINNENNTKITEKDKKLVNGTQTTYLHNTSTYYFYNLTENYAKNYKGTCTYVAMIMLLQYYDSIWDDNIIPARFEVESISTVSINSRTSSPGIRADKIPGLTDSQAEDLTNLEYFNYVMNMTESYFQPFLFKIAHEDFDVDYITMASEDCFAAFSQAGRRMMLNHYLQNYVGYSSSDYTLEVFGQDAGSLPSDTVRNHVIEKVKKGIPVLVCTATNSSSHTSIAYDYDASTDTLYFNWGSKVPNTHYGLQDDTSITINSAMTLEFHGQHTHANNYKLVTNGNVTQYCGCHLSYHKHVAHTIDVYNDEYHIENCFCGYSKRDYHSCTGNMGRYEPCLECGTIVDLWSVNTNSFIREEELEIA